jgi:dTDP-4-dehydrorhamnose 3,5-epimerase-like enzyme
MKFQISKYKKYFNKTGCLIPFYKRKNFGNFKITRFFFLYGKLNSFRANHAHKKCNQIYIPITGKILVEITTKKNRYKKILLNNKNKNYVKIPKMTWTKITFKENKSTLLVLCDYKYDRKEYIENKAEFLEL